MSFRKVEEADKIWELMSPSKGVNKQVNKLVDSKEMFAKNLQREQTLMMYSH